MHCGIAIDILYGEVKCYQLFNTNMCIHKAYVLPALRKLCPEQKCLKVTGSVLFVLFTSIVIFYILPYRPKGFLFFVFSTFLGMNIYVYAYTLRMAIHISTFFGIITITFAEYSIEMKS